MAVGGEPDEPVRRLHEKYAHATIKQLKEMAINGELDGEPLPTRRALGRATGMECADCAAGKTRIKKQKKKKARQKDKYEPFELMICDHAGSNPVGRLSFLFGVGVCVY